MARRTTTKACRCPADVGHHQSPAFPRRQSRGKSSGSGVVPPFSENAIIPGWNAFLVATTIKRNRPGDASNPTNATHHHPRRNRRNLGGMPCPLAAIQESRTIRPGALVCGGGVARKLGRCPTFPGFGNRKRRGAIHSPALRLFCWWWARARRHCPRFLTRWAIMSNPPAPCRNGRPIRTSGTSPKNL